MPEISLNLISVGQLLECGYSLHFHDKWYNVSNKDGKLLASVKMNDRSFALNTNTNEFKACPSLVDNTEL